MIQFVLGVSICYTLFYFISLDRNFEKVLTEKKIDVVHQSKMSLFEESNSFNKANFNKF